MVSPLAIKVRPFAEQIEGIRAGTAPEMRGFVRGDAFVIAVLDREFEVRARAIDSDERGVYALLDESEQRLDFGALLRISPEYEPDMPPGGEIQPWSERFSRARFEEAARPQGIDTDRVNLMVPPLRSVRVYFDSDGTINGRGMLG